MVIDRLKRMLCLVTLVSVFIAGTGIFCFAADSYQATVEDLSDNAYFPKAKEAIGNAKDSIYMMMYFVSFNAQSKNSPVNQLVEELINAHKRGVKVKIILDQNIDFSTLGGGGKWERENKNDALFLYLKANGIDVYYDNLFMITHSKVIIIDEEIVILGSANWTMSSLRRNWEGSCLIRSKELAKKFLDNFSKVTIDYEASILDEERRPPVLLSGYFMKNTSLGPRMVTNNDQIAFNLYLLLLRNFNGNKEGRVDVDYKVFSQALGLEGRFSYISTRDNILRALARLDDKYHLITRVKRPPKSPYVILLDYPNTKPYILPQDEYCSIPDEYWKYGWNKKLSIRESYCYLICRCRGGAKRGNVWSDHIIGLSKDFNVSRDTIKRGMQALRALNIIEIDYAPYLPEENFRRRDASLFKLLRLYSLDVLEKEKERVRRIYGKKHFEEAEKYAKIVFKGNDIQVIEDVIKKTDEYGALQVKEAFKTVSVKSIDNPKRSYRYVVGVLQKKAEEMERD